MTRERLPLRDPRTVVDGSLHLFRRRWTALFALPLQLAFLAAFLWCASSPAAATTPGAAASCSRRSAR